MKLQSNWVFIFCRNKVFDWISIYSNVWLNYHIIWDNICVNCINGHNLKTYKHLISGFFFFFCANSFLSFVLLFKLISYLRVESHKLNEYYFWTLLVVNEDSSEVNSLVDNKWYENIFLENRALQTVCLSNLP